MPSQDDIYNSLDAVNNELTSFSKVLAANSKSVGSVNAALKADLAAKEKMKAAQENLSNTITNTAIGLTSFGKSLISGQGSFQPLTQVVTLVTKTLGELAGKIPLVGGAFKGMIQGAGQVANFMIEQFDRTYGVFEKLSDTGVVSTFSDLKEAAQGMNLSIADTESALTKHSKNLALFASSAIDGRKQFQALASASSLTRTDFQKLGISSKEFNDMQMSYLNQQMRLTGGQRQTVEQMQKGSEDYIKELDIMAKLTGSSRQAIVAERDARLNDARYVASMSSLPKEIRENIDKGLDATTAVFGKATSAALQDIISTDGAGITKAGTALVQTLSASGMNVAQTVAGLKNGSISWTQLMEQLTKTSAINKKQFAQLASLMGSDTDITMLYAELAKGSLAEDKNWQKMLEEEHAKQERIIRETDTDNANLAKTKQSIENLQKTMENMATDSELVSKLLPMMAEGIEDLTIELFTKMGLTVPPLLRAQKDLRDAQKVEREVVRRRVQAESDAARRDARYIAVDGTSAVTGFQRRPTAARIAINEQELEKAIKDEENAKQAVEQAKKRLEEQIAKQTTQTTAPTGGTSAPPSPATPASSTPSGSASPPPAASAGANNTTMPPAPPMPTTGQSSSGSPSTNSSAAPSPVSFTPGGPATSAGSPGSSTIMNPTQRPLSSPKTGTVTGSSIDLKQCLATICDKMETLAGITEQNADSAKQQLSRRVNG